MPEPSILSFEEARHTVEQHAAQVHSAATEKIELLKSAGRVLAEEIHADRDFPPFPRAARDGYAVRSSDLRQLPARLQVIAEIKAGASANQLLKNLVPGQAAAIMTGAPAPAGADAVVMVEYTSRDGDEVEITKGIGSGDNIVPPGSEARQGCLLLSPGTRLAEAAIAALASVGKSQVTVYAKPRVAVLATGDEIVGIDSQPGPTQIRNSNSYSLAAQILAAGGQPVLLPVAPDEPARLTELIESGLRYDLLLLAGGVSMGKYDLVEEVLEDFQAEFFFAGAQIQPGRPIVFGRVVTPPPLPVLVGASHPSPPSRGPSKTTYFFGLPGNPVSTMVTFELFARPLMEALAGMTPRKLVFTRARLKSDLKTKTGLKRFLPGILSGEFEDAEVELAPWHGSGDIAATARANCYIVIPPDRERIPADEWVPVLVR
jgi:molybdopterin molybdotransferase